MSFSRRGWTASPTESDPADLDLRNHVVPVPGQVFKGHLKFGGLLGSDPPLASILQGRTRFLQDHLVEGILEEKGQLDSPNGGLSIVGQRSFHVNDFVPQEVFPLGQPQPGEGHLAPVGLLPGR